MTTNPAVSDLAAAGQHLTAIAASLSTQGLASRLTRTGDTPILTVDAPGGGPDPASISIHPDPYADPGHRPGPRLDCTCTWTPSPRASPQATAIVIGAVLDALRPASPEPSSPGTGHVSPSAEPNDFLERARTRSSLRCSLASVYQGASLARAVSLSAGEGISP